MTFTLKLSNFNLALFMGAIILISIVFNSWYFTASMESPTLSFEFSKKPMTFIGRPEYEKELFWEDIICASGMATIDVELSVS